MRLQLDTNSLRALIKDNPSFELEIKKNVLDNIKLDQIKDSVRIQIELALKTMCEKSGSYYDPKYKIVEPKLIAAMNAVIENTVYDLIEKSVEQKVSRIVEQERTKIAGDMKQIAKEALLLAITPEVAKEVLLQKLL